MRLIPARRIDADPLPWSDDCVVCRVYRNAKMDPEAAITRQVLRTHFVQQHKRNINLR